MDYNSAVSALRELARDELRLSLVNNQRINRLEVQNAFDARTKQNEEENARIAKRLAVLSFKTSQLSDADPEKTDKIQKYADETAELQASQEQENKDFATDSADLTKQLAGIDLKIADIQSGKTKVSMEALADCTDRLAHEVIAEIAREKAQNLAAEVTVTPVV